MRHEPRSRAGGYVLAAFCIAMAATLVALAADGWIRMRNAARAGEATRNVGTIAYAAVDAWERGVDTPRGPQLCGSSTRVPAHLVPGGKYKPKRADFQVGSLTEGWPCLEFKTLAPINYQYQYVADGRRFETIAVGDLDADGVVSRFSLGGSVDLNGIHVDPGVRVQDENE